MDLEEQAQELEALQRENAIAAARAPIAGGDWWKVSAKWCEGPACGERIPDERRRAIPGVKFCVTCKEIEEREKGRMKR